MDTTLRIGILVKRINGDTVIAVVDPVQSPGPLEAKRPAGRCFPGTRKVRLGDVDTNGRLRLDALTRYTQDVSDDDTTDAGLPDNPGWVVRSTVVDELIPARLGEWLHVLTFCSGLGKRWAERRLSISGEGGARYEVATLWVCVDTVSGHPHTLTDQFIGLYGPAADDRRVSARLRNPKPWDLPQDALHHSQWQLRAADFDVFGHVNNAAYWALLEEPPQTMTASGEPWPRRARLEYGAGLTPAPSVAVAQAEVDGGQALWWLEDATGGATDSKEATGASGSGLQRPTVAASGFVIPIPGDLYLGGL